MSLLFCKLNHLSRPCTLKIVYIKAFRLSPFRTSSILNDSLQLWFDTLIILIIALPLKLAPLRDRHLKSCLTLLPSLLRRLILLDNVAL